jgi:hypothetical protein
MKATPDRHSIILLPVVKNLESISTPEYIVHFYLRGFYFYLSVNSRTSWASPICPSTSEKLTNQPKKSLVNEEK